MTVQNHVQIRPAAMKDAGGIATLCAQLGYPSTAAAVEQRLDYILNSADHALFVAENTRGDLVGWAHVHKYAVPYAEMIADVGGLIVDQNHRRQGIGRKLVERIEQWARENDAAVTIRTNVVREESHRFYKALGYDRVKKQFTYIKQ